MATLVTMYPGQANSPPTTTTGALAIDTEQVTVLNGDILPEPPNLLVLGGETSGAETVLMTAKNGDALTLRRAVQGAAKAWPAGTTIARNFTAADYDALRENILALDGNKAPKSHASTATEYGAASTTEYGHMRFATDAEATAGEIATKAVNPKQLLIPLSALPPDGDWKAWLEDLGDWGGPAGPPPP